MKDCLTTLSVMAFVLCLIAIALALPLSVILVFVWAVNLILPPYEATIVCSVFGVVFAILGVAFIRRL